VPADTPNDPVREVLSEVQAGDGLSLSAAGRLFPGHRGNGSVDPSTLFRWVTRGTRTADGRVVRLEAIRTPGRWVTSRGAVARFVAVLTAAADLAAVPSVPAPRSAATHRRASERAADALKRMGA
jgi:hypothetical protein